MRRLLAIIALVTSAACSASETIAPAQSPAVGKWTLITVDGAPLPWTFMGSGANKSELMGTTGSLEANGTWASTYTLRTTTNGQQSTQSGSSAGSWTLTGNAVALRSLPDGNVTSGTVSGNTMTLNDGQTKVYMK